jgi:glycosyltransferase involved in cell wall biosynthesis
VKFSSRPVMIRHMADAAQDGRYTILHLGKYYPPHPGGMETHLRDLAIRQANSAQVHVIVANSAWRTERLTDEGVSVTRLGRLASIASMPVCPGLRPAIRNSPADLVHIHAPNPGAAFAFLASGHSAKLVVTHHADTIGRNFLRRFSDPVVTRMMERASRILVTSHQYLESSAELAAFRTKCRVVPLGIDPAIAASADPAATESLRLRFPDGFILGLGRLVPYKGFDVLIQAMKWIDKKLLLIGTGPLQEELKRLAAAEGVGDKVDLLGRVEDTRPYFAAASVFVLPSVTRAEAFGIVQLEAMAAGIPIVNTSIDSGVPEVCTHGTTAITVPPGDPMALGQAIQMLLDRKDLRAKLGGAAKARVNAEFTADLMCTRTMRIYEEVLQRSIIS